MCTVHFKNVMPLLDGGGGETEIGKRERCHKGLQPNSNEGHSGSVDI